MRVLPQGSPQRNPKGMAPRSMEVDENAAPKRSVVARSASPQRKKVLGERNGGGGEGPSAAAPQPKVAASPPSVGGGVGTYDPKTNYTTPRPDFLRYDPKRSQELFLRLEREVEDECPSATSGTEVSESVSSGSSAAGSDSEFDDEEEEEEVTPAHGGGRARRLFLLLVAAAGLFCYIHCMNSTPFPDTSDEALNFVGLNGSMYDVGVHESLLGPIDMMGLEDKFEADIGQNVYGDSHDSIHLHGSGGPPSNLMAIAMMGLWDACPNVPFGEFTCQIRDESSGNVDDLNKDSEVIELKPEAICSGGDVVGDSIGSTYSDDTTEDKLRVRQGKCEDNSKHSVPELVAMEEIMESESAKSDDDTVFQSEKLGQEFDALEYEKTAEAAKACFAMVKFSWSAMEPHLMKMLACLSVAGFVTVMFKYFQRSGSVQHPVPRHMPSVPPARVPVLAPHNIAHLPVFHSPQESSVCLEHPVQSSLRNPLNAPSMGRGHGDQKIEQGDADIVKASDSNTMDRKETNSLNPPDVQLLGEFSFVDAGSSRGRFVEDSNWHGADVKVQETLSLSKGVVKMEKESSIIQSPRVQRARKKESAAEAETPTPLRRSNRLRKTAT